MIDMLIRVQFGLVPAILIGPLVFQLIQASLGRGKAAGLVIGAGQCFSDALFILIPSSLRNIDTLAGKQPRVQNIATA